LTHQPVMTQQISLTSSTRESADLMPRPSTRQAASNFASGIHTRNFRPLAFASGLQTRNFGPLGSLLTQVSRLKFRFRPPDAKFQTPCLAPHPGKQTPNLLPASRRLISHLLPLPSTCRSAFNLAFTF